MPLVLTHRRLPSKRLLKRQQSLFCFIVFTSMGGAVAVHVAAERLLSSLVGVVVIDVVEGIN